MKQDGPGPKSLASSTSDFFFAYPSYVAYRSTDKGSCFITELCRALVTHATDSSLSDIMAEVTHKLGEYHTHEIMQTSEATTRLGQKVFFLW